MKDRIHVECREDGIVWVRMQDEEGRNTLSEPFVKDLRDALRHVAADTSIKVCVLCGLPDVFCAGADRELLIELARGKIDPADITLERELLDLPIPTLAAMEGHAVGGGLALGIGCDMTIMARESRYGCSFMNMGFTPGMGLTRLLAPVVGSHVANEMMFGGQFFLGSHFESHGVNYVLPRAEVLAKATDMARRIAEKPRVALELLKREVSLQRRRALDEALVSETEMHRICFAQPDAADRIRENYV